MANYGSVSRYHLVTLRDWLSRHGAKVSVWFDVSMGIRPSVRGRCRRISIGPFGQIDTLGSLRPAWVAGAIEHRIASTIDRTCVELLLSSRLDVMEVRDLSEIISVEVMRLQGGLAVDATIFSNPSKGSIMFCGEDLRLDRPVFLTRWDLVMSGHVPRDEVIRMDRRSCSIVPIEWPRLDRVGESLIDGGSIDVDVCVSDVSRVARYRFASDIDGEHGECRSRLIA